MNYYKQIHVNAPVDLENSDCANSLIKKGVDVQFKDVSEIEMITDKFWVDDGKSKKREWRKFKRILSEVKGELDLPSGFKHTELECPEPVKPVKPDLSEMSRSERKKHKSAEKEKILSKVKIIDDPEEDFDHFIEVAVACTWFQKRLSWMLSSILQQKGDVPSIIFNVAYIKGNGDPTTEATCQFFRHLGLNIKETVYDDHKIIQKRGFARNRQLIESKAKWIMFADCDMAYDPYFFDDLAKQLRGDFRKESRCISGRRISLDKQYCKDKLNSDPSENYPRVVENSGELEDWPVYTISSPCGAGYMQLANVRTTRANTDGLYVSPDENPDYAEQDKFHKTKSDRVFRRKINGVKRIQTKPQYHLNHERENEEGCHIKFQR